MKPLYKSILVCLAYMVGMIILGISGGFLVKWLSDPWIVQEWMSNGAPLWPPSSAADLWMTIAYGTTYATGLGSTILIIRHIAYRYIPLRNLRDVVLHMGLMAAGVVGIFMCIKLLDPVICIIIQGEYIPEDNPESISTVVSMGAAFIIAMVLYSIDFYRDMRRARQTALVAELRALRAQINPHFLFNTLNSIAALVHKSPDEAERVVEELADLFRYTLRASQYPTVSLREELTATNRYLAIEKARFPERMTVIRKIDEKLLDARVPSLLIQPLVENAVKHGVSKTEDYCAIYLAVAQRGGMICLSVRDTGPGFDSTDPKEVFSNGTGLANVRDRLKLHFGEQAMFSVLPDGIQLLFPYRTEPDKQIEVAAKTSSQQD